MNERPLFVFFSLFLPFLFLCLSNTPPTPVCLCQTMEEAETADCSLMDRDIMQVIFTLAKSGHEQHIPDMVERLRHERGYVPGTHAHTLFMFSSALFF